MKHIQLFILLLMANLNFAQLGIGTATPNANSSLEISSSSKGVKFVSLATAPASSPAKGLTYYDTTLQCLRTNFGTPAAPLWKCMGAVATPPVIGALDCANAVVSNYNFIPGRLYEGGTVTVNYTGGNGAAYPATSVNSLVGSNGGTAGLTATLPAGTLAIGAGSLVFTISGTPNIGSVATFPITVGGQTCSFTLQTCGAYLGAGQTSWKNFMCHNLGADYTKDPNILIAATQQIHGNYYQWGRVAPVATQTAIIGTWNTTVPASTSLNDATKTANDPCPAGFRVPTIAQWQNVIGNIAGDPPAGTFHNTPINVSANDFGNFNPLGFSSALTYRTGGIVTLTLPAAGLRNPANGSLANRDASGIYMSSTTGSGNNARKFNFVRDRNTGSAPYGIGPYQLTNSIDVSRASGYSVRCIKE